MSKREKILALGVALIVGGWLLLTWVIDPAFAAFADIDEQTEQLKQELSLARSLVDNESKIRKGWAGYEKAGLSRSMEAADAETGRALLAWADEAGLSKVKLSDGKDKVDDEQPFGELRYTVQTAGKLEQIYKLLWSIHQSPFPLRVEKCVIDVQNNDGENLQLSLSVSTLFKPEAQTE